MVVTVPASQAILEFYNHDHAKDGSGKFSKDNGVYRKGAGSSASQPGAKPYSGPMKNKGRGYPKAAVKESGKYDDSGNEHVGVNISDNANRQKKEKLAADTKKFTDAANKIAKRDGIDPGEAARRLGRVLQGVHDRRRTPGPR